MRKFRKIGVVGGVGPYAGILLNKMIFDESMASLDQDFPEVCLISASGKIADRTEYLLSPETAVNPAYAISEIAETLAATGSEIIVIPCNTAHSPAIFEVVKSELLEKKVSALLINMIDEVIKELSLVQIRLNKNKLRIGLLATRGTNKSGVYHDAIKKNSGMEFVPLSEEYIDLVHETIYHREYGLKATGGNVSDNAVKNLNSAINELISKGADCIIFGCTELSLAVPEMKTDVPIIDTLRVLASAALEKN